MSIADNTNSLQSILAKVESLPEAGGGATIETCTVTINVTTSRDKEIYICYIDKNNDFVDFYDGFPSTVASRVYEFTVVKNSIMIVSDYGYLIHDQLLDKQVTFSTDGGMFSYYIYIESDLDLEMNY